MIPIRCTRCGYTFTNNLIHLTGNVREATISNVGTTCPRCGGPAHMADGVYNHDASGLSLVRGPATSREMFEALYGVVHKAAKDDLSATEILAEVAGINPDLAKKLQRRGLPAFALILALVWLLKNVSFNVDLDLNRAIDQAIHAVGAQAAPIAAPPAPPPPPPAPAPVPSPDERGSLPTTVVASLAEPLSRRARRRQRGRERTRRR